MAQSLQEFFHDFRQETLASAEATGAYQLEAFMDAMSKELIETGFIEGYEFCSFRSPRGSRADGHWFNDEGVLDVFIADHDCRRELANISKTEVEAAFRRLVGFLQASIAGKLEPDVTTPEYALVREIYERRGDLYQVNFFLLSERALSEKFQASFDDKLGDLSVTYHIWDMSRLLRQRDSRGQKEPLNIDLEEMFGSGVNCLPANFEVDSYQSFLLVMPATHIAALYGRYSARLLEQNVRTFLQARAQVNKGIRATIINEPHMFFAYNNGITATASSVQTRRVDGGLQITQLVDLQIVNGGQTTASLFHTMRKDKADLSKIFVQMKLSVIDGELSEKIVPRISEYANTQNRVNAADFFSNHPYHVRMADFSRRIWAPAVGGAQRETKWFYERARGQYADAQANMTVGEQKRFRTEYPKGQLVEKTALAKYENVFDDHPKWVNLGAQKNFARYAHRIGKDWDKASDGFNEYHFKRAIARGIIFKSLERIVSASSWYNGGYRANVVAYTLAMVGHIASRNGKSLDYLRIWQRQTIDEVLADALCSVSEQVFYSITNPAQGISNVTEWCKKDACWDRLLSEADKIEHSLDAGFALSLVSEDEHLRRAAVAKENQRLDNGIEEQRYVLAIPSSAWKVVHDGMVEKGLVTPKEAGILSVAMRMPKKIPSELQSRALIGILKRAKEAGISPSA